MPTENEVRVLTILNSIEIEPDAAQTIESLGSDAVTILCEAALGTYPGLRAKIRYNAVALLGLMNNPQAKETILLLLSDPDPDVAIRAMRASGRQKNAGGVDTLSTLLGNPQTPTLLAAEALSALMTIGTGKALAGVETYRNASLSELPHRGSRVVEGMFSAGQWP